MNMKNLSVRRLVRCAVIAAVYVVVCLVLAPFSYGAVQVRVAEALCLLPVFGAEYIVGVTLGCFLANLLGSTVVDVVFGTLATLLACLVTYKLRDIRVKGLAIPASLPPVVFNMIIVGAFEITFFFSDGAPTTSNQATIYNDATTYDPSKGDGIDARVVMPLYGDLKFKDTLTYVTNFSVPVGWRSQYCGLFKAERDGVVFYFIDNEYYFKRSGLYGFYDDGERFAFFSRAILEMLFYTDFEPDIINCNDWQTALTPVYLNLYYRHLDKFSRIKTVFTIHNIAYQGKYGLDILEDTCGIGARDAHVVEYDGCANFMKGAIECADKVTTVSPTYAQEILDPWFSHGLDGLLRQKQYKLCGILNGIDVDVFNPDPVPDHS
jgi:uncharacterized membrane protein